MTPTTQTLEMFFQSVFGFLLDFVRQILAAFLF